MLSRFNADRWSLHAGQYLPLMLLGTGRHLALDGNWNEPRTGALEQLFAGEQLEAIIECDAEFIVGLGLLEGFVVVELLCAGSVIPWVLMSWVAST